MTDTVPVAPGTQLSNLQVLSVAPLIGEAIGRIHRGESVGALFSSEIQLVQEMLLWGTPDEERQAGSTTDG